MHIYVKHVCELREVEDKSKVLDDLKKWKLVNEEYR